MLFRSRDNPNRQEARDDAREARARAAGSARALGEQGPDVPLLEDAALPSKRSRSETLKKLYHQAARLLHPDLTLDGQEKEKRHRLMCEVNDAYARGDEARIRAIIRDWHASPESVQGDGPGAELVRVIRKIAQVEKRLLTIAAELAHLDQGELFSLKKAVEEAQANGRDLLTDLGDQLDRDIAQLRDELQRSTSKGTP